MKAVVFTLGCKVNICESASLIGGLKSLGYEVSDELERADLYIINTCAVTQEAEKKSRQAIARVRRYNKNAKIIITGCASEKSPQDFIEKDGVTLVTGTKAKDKILQMLDKSGIKIEKNDDYYEEYLPPKTLKTRSYIKVQDGCDNFCAYCIIPYLRGRSRSRDICSIKREIEHLSPKEAVLTGINLSDYDGGLDKLIDGLQGVDTRIRLGSLEVNVITEEFLSATKKLKDFAPHFHLSLQSGSDKVLKDMNRHYTAEEYANKVNLIRKYYSDAGITTDIIVGYPTETEQDFLDTVSLVERVKFSDIHCFPYSAREGTRSYKLKDISAEVKKDRLNRLLEYKYKYKAEFIEKFIGKKLNFLPEDEEDGFTVGYTENYIRVYVSGVRDRDIQVVIPTTPYKDGVIAKLDK